MPIWLAVLAWCLPASGNVGETYGFGSKSASLAATGAAGGVDAFAAYYNPAALGKKRDSRVAFDWSTLYMRPIFEPIDGVVVENEFTSDKVRTGNVDQEYRTTFGQAIGLSARVLPDHWNLSAGVVTFLPANQLAYLDTGETYIPEYFLYRARTQRPQFNLGLGAEPGQGFSFGAGVYIGFTMTSDAKVFLQTAADKPSTMRFKASLKPKAAPYAGMLLAPDALPWSGGVVVRGPLDSPNYMTLNSGARAFGTLAALDFKFEALSSLFYDPLTVEVGNSLKLFQMLKVTFQLDYQLWSKFQGPALIIEDPKTENCQGCGVEVSPGKKPSYTFKDIVVPRLAGEIEIGHWALRGGYFFRPSILKDLPTGMGNYLDPPKEGLSAGLGYSWKGLGSFEVPCHVDFHFAYHHLFTQKVEKTKGDERGSGTGDTKIGAPGYTAGGKVFGGGMSLSVEI